MKPTTKLLLSAIALLSSMGCTPVAAQGKKLPAKIHLELSDKEYQALYNKIDSLIGLASNTSNLPANVINPFLARFNATWLLLDHKVFLQLVPVDSVKVNPVKGVKP